MSNARVNTLLSKQNYFDQIAELQYYQSMLLIQDELRNRFINSRIDTETTTAFNLTIEAIKKQIKEIECTLEEYRTRTK